MKKNNVQQAEIYYGLDGYTKPLIRRIEADKSPIKHFVNGKSAAVFHKMTGYLVNQIISQRVEKGLEIKNLIRQEDQDLQIELSNPKTLKETRLLPKGFKNMNVVFAVFGNTVALSSFDKTNQLGVIITNSTIAKAFGMIFDAIWEHSTPK